MFKLFITVNKIWILKKIFPKIIIPKAVYKEFKEPLGNYRIKEINKLIEEGFIEVKTIQVNTKEHYTFKQIKDGDLTGKCAGNGESAALSLAIHNKGIIVSNNTKDVIKIVNMYKLKWLRVGDILEIAITKKIIKKSKAEEIWQEMKDKNRFLGKWETVNKYLEEKYSK